LIGIPLGNILGPLIVWLIKRNEYPAVDQEGKESLNFQISMTIYLFATMLLCFIFIGFILLVPLILTNIVFTIIASIKVSEGKTYEYPISIRFLK